MNVSYVRNTLIFIAILLLIANQVWLSSFTTDIMPVLHHVKPNVTLLLMITTHAGEYTRRNIMRETYLSFSDRQYTWMFIVGKGNVTKELQQEQKEHNDIYLLDCHDGYYNLTEKILRGFEVAVDNFDFTFLLKVDTDTYVQVPKFIDYLNQFANTPASYYGVHGVWSPKLSHSPDELVPSERRSWYMLGGGYALTYDLVKYPMILLIIDRYFAENWQLMHQWKPEDLTIGIHLQYLNINRVPDTNIFKTDNTEILCDHDYLVNHKASALQMFYLHYSSMITGGMCMYQQNESLRKKIMMKAIEAYDKMLGTE